MCGFYTYWDCVFVYSSIYVMFFVFYSILCFFKDLCGTICLDCKFLSEFRSCHLEIKVFHFAVRFFEFDLFLLCISYMSYYVYTCRLCVLSLYINILCIYILFILPVLWLFCVCSNVIVSSDFSLLLHLDNKNNLETFISWLSNVFPLFFCEITNRFFYKKRIFIFLNRHKKRVQQSMIMNAHN